MTQYDKLFSLMILTLRKLYYAESENVLLRARYIINWLTCVFFTFESLYYRHENYYGIDKLFNLY